VPEILIFLPANYRQKLYRLATYRGLIPGGGPIISTNRGLHSTCQWLAGDYATCRGAPRQTATADLWTIALPGQPPVLVIPSHNIFETFLDEKSNDMENKPSPATLKKCLLSILTISSPSHSRETVPLN